MQIKEYVYSNKDAGLSESATPRDALACSRDSCFFSSTLEQSTAAKLSAGAAQISPFLTDAIKPLTTSRARLSNIIKSNTKEVDIEKFRLFPSALSNIQLTSQLLVKSLAKTTQGIEKISNLQ
ncbi:type III secretion apparatus protein RspB [Pseudomonas sp. SR18]|uniref:type III secretion apparatus protein RspB n=1 Tax=Pseudomonas sp. SR18 TaxID=1461074 RepID=UPI0020346001|nr:type III secretion apparatus protein RspB [Pseudomonas sp. SR18]MCM2362739.1 type III secretion apparatus protein RspB [Pseudomonas sp. SR18]